jgi:hypothetical protein
MGAFALAAGLLIVAALIALAFSWQGSLRLRERAVTYGIEDAVEFITGRLSPATAALIGERSVRRILEWEMKYLQDALADEDEKPVVLGGPEAAAYVAAQTAAQGHQYAPEVIDEVLELQGRYLVAIGAVAEPAVPGAGDGGNP